MKKLLLVIMMAGILAVTTAGAEELNDAITGMLASHDRMAAAEAEVLAAENSARVALGRWFPNINLTSELGRSRLDTQTTDLQDDYMDPALFEAKLTQLLWDFGKTNGEVRKAKAGYEKAVASRDNIRQELVLEGVSAYLKLKQSEQQLVYAIKSVDSIKKQANMEDTRISAGQGYSTDALQAKAQLLGAEARLTRVEGLLQGAKNRAQNVFNRPAEEISALTMGGSVSGLLPSTLEEAIDVSLQNSPELKVANNMVLQAEEQYKASKADAYFPVINGVLDYNYKNDYGAIDPIRQESLAFVEVKYDFDLGFTSVNSARSAKEGYRSAVKNRDDLKNKVVENVRNAWQNVLTADKNAKLLRDQSDIVAQFLDLAKKERKLGRRSLLDVLSAEVSLINAQSDAAAAEADVTIYGYTLLKSMGKL
jgi:adhesin transport system outer membrane protein